MKTGLINISQKTINTRFVLW